MSNFPEDLKYAKSHEWVKKEGEFYSVGISDFAQEQLGDIVYVDLPEVGDSVDKGDTLGELESSKAVSDINMPLTGEIIEINNILKDVPELINSDPYAAWIVKIRASNSDDYKELLNSREAKEAVEGPL